MAFAINCRIRSHCCIRRPEHTREQIVLHASHQYLEGDVQHWWHEETERGIRTTFSDDLLWMPYAVSRYIEHTGDESFWTKSHRFFSVNLCVRMNMNVMSRPSFQSKGHGF